MYDLLGRDGSFVPCTASQQANTSLKGACDKSCTKSERRRETAAVVAKGEERRAVMMIFGKFCPIIQSLLNRKKRSENWC